MLLKHEFGEYFRMYYACKQHTKNSVYCVNVCTFKLKDIFETIFLITVISKI